MLVVRVENVDAIVALTLDDRPRRRVTIDADQHGWRIERKRDGRGNGEPRSRLFERRKLLGLGRDLSKRHGHCATLARSEVSRLAESTITPSQNRLAQ